MSMRESATQIDGRTALPLLPLTDSEQQSSAPSWRDWTPLTPLPDSPEPDQPQGVYSDTPAQMVLEAAPVASQRGPVELLAPAGGPEAAFAAFHFGADAIYLGLKKFSARAEAENFTLPEVDEITAYAHGLQPRRRVFVTLNTLIRQDELAELVEAVAALADMGVDALIVQDLGVYHLVRAHFPQLELHASTQLSVHNRAGAEALHRLGFRRVVLARELTFEEVRDITSASGIETEVFIHGALCYSYSGLCLFSAQTLGRSGNRGKCAYSCRDSYEVAGVPLQLRDGAPVRRDPRQGFPFSMKDLALPDHIPALRGAGVSCFKIEGRKKSPLYVATTTRYYRKLIDGELTDDERPALEADMQSVFSRPWTRLFVQSHKDKEVADRDTVGHRGTPIGEVEAVHGDAEPRLRFHTRRALERHDGLQIDLPVLGRPFGFALERMWIVTPRRHGKRQEVFEAPANTLVEVSLPRDHPDIPAGAPVYCSSSQAVKQKYRHSRPKPGLHRVRQPIAVEVIVTAAEISAIAHLLNRHSDTAIVAVRRTLAGPFPPARDRNAVEQAARGAFEKLGDTPLLLDAFTFRNETDVFVPISRLNQLRRDVVEDLEKSLRQKHAERVARLQILATPPQPTHVEPRTAFRWSIKVDRLGFLDALEESDLTDIDEIIVDIARDHLPLLHEQLGRWSARVGRERIRLALPALTRSWEDRSLRHKIESLIASGWTKWEAANLSAWSYLGLDPVNPHSTALDLSTDWSVYVINRLAARALERMGVHRFTLSPEDGLENVRSLLHEFGSRAVLIVYQDTPLFVAESCAYANLIGGCPGKANCRFESMEMVSSHGEKVTALDYHCRTIVLNQGPFCLSTRLDELRRAGAVSLRADFIYRNYQPAEVQECWRLLRAGQAVPRGQSANFARGLL
ncbi:MAG: peptidase U32 family protein [Gemmataceae bacterium]